jgi:hypothetical protein
MVAMVYATPFSRHDVFAIAAPGIRIWSFAMSRLGHAQDALRYIVGGWHVRESSHAGRPQRMVTSVVVCGGPLLIYKINECCSTLKDISCFMCWIPIH